MKLALIPPISHVHDIGKTSYQLMLPHLIGNDIYDRAYKAAVQRGDYVILDNGIAEGLKYRADELHTLAVKCHVSELVLPDIIGDRIGTLQAIEAAYMHLPHRRTYRLMAVVQGEDWGDIVECLKTMSEYSINTIGIPRHLESTIAKGTREKVVRHIRHTTGERFAIHLLGTNPEHIRELRTYRVTYNALNVRGCDTSAPYNYTYGDAFIREGGVVKRPEDYFALRHVKNHGLLRDNIAAMEEWTGATVSSES